MRKVFLEETKNRRRLNIGSVFVDLNETDYRDLVRIFSTQTTSVQQSAIDYAIEVFGKYDPDEQAEFDHFVEHLLNFSKRITGTLPESPSEQSSTVGVEEPDEKWFIHEGIEFSKKIKTDSESYKLGTGFGYSCGLQDGYKKFASLSEGEEAIGFAEWLNENRWYTYDTNRQKWCYTFEHGTSLPKGAYEKNYMKTSEELFNIYKLSKK